MDVKQIDKLEALLAKATPGPWTIKEDKIIPESHVRRHFGGSIDPVRDTAFAWPIASLRRDSLPRWTEETIEANAAIIAEAINALPALLQLARVVSEAHVAVLHEADDDRGHEWLECRLELGWEQHKAMAGQTVALVPVPVKEG